MLLDGHGIDNVIQQNILSGWVKLVYRISETFSGLIGLSIFHNC